MYEVMRKERKRLSVYVWKGLVLKISDASQMFMLLKGTFIARC